MMVMKILINKNSNFDVIKSAAALGTQIYKTYFIVSIDYNGFRQHVLQMDFSQ